jgi:hypothetical protein
MNNVWCAIVPTIPGINCPGLSEETSITILEVIRDVSWNQLLLNSTQHKFLPIFEGSISIRICYRRASSL